MGLQRFNPQARFSTRVENYRRYRPDYPGPAIRFLIEHCGLHLGATVADVGAGTGKLTLPLLEAGLTVYGVEPNEAMREAAQADLGRFAGFRSVAGTAEHTQLLDASVDLLVAAQAFHWFDHAAARLEAERVLRSPGWVALIWNNRRQQAGPISSGFEEMLLRHCPDYAAIGVEHAAIETIQEFFAPHAIERTSLPNAQVFDWEGLCGRLLSSSYAPLEGPGHQAMMAALRELFDRTHRDGRVTMEYDTELFVGAIKPRLER